MGKMSVNFNTFQLRQPKGTPTPLLIAFLLVYCVVFLIVYLIIKKPIFMEVSLYLKTVTTLFDISLRPIRKTFKILIFFMI